MDNGFLQATIAKPAGYVSGIKYNGIENILDTLNPEDDRGYFYISNFLFKFKLFSWKI